MMKLRAKLLNEDATIPTRAHLVDAGLDLYCSKDTFVNREGTTLVPTGVAVEIPPGYVGLIRDRSSVGKKGLKVTAGVIDAGYTGEVCVVLLNVCAGYTKVEKGQKVAQLLIIPIETPEVEVVKEFAETERGDKGFGSSDK